MIHKKHVNYTRMGEQNQLTIFYNLNIQSLKCRVFEKSVKCIVIMKVLQDEPQILGTTNGSIGGRKYFQCHKNHGKFVLLSDLVKEEEFFNIITGAFLIH